jgi:hypothetical protein
MARHSETTGGEASEQTPLLAKPAVTNGHGSVSVPTAEVPVEEPLIGNGANGTILKPGTDDEESQGQGEVEDATDRSHAARIISVLLIGIFVAHADGSILLATHPIIASEFNDLENSSWLITGFALAGAATQTLYGKLSDIYGRKTLVITAYIIFVVGCAIV